MEFNQISEKFIQEMKSKCKDPEIEFYEDDKTIKYIGDFNTKNLFHGFGIYFLENGKKIYEGYWKNGLMDNNGIFYKNNKITYKGNWKNGQKHGKGQSYYKNGNIQYEGEWKEKT